MSLSKVSYDDRRSHERKSVLADAVIEYENKESPCKVHDISVGGAKIEAHLPPSSNLSVKLKFGQFGSIPAEVAWQHENQHGIKFLGEPEQLAEMLTAIAIYS